MNCFGFTGIPARKKHTDYEWRWQLAPAYDLTLCTEGYNGQHATSVNGTGKPTADDFIAVGRRIKMPEKRCLEIITELSDSCGALLRYRI